jgi:endoglycosylceramidase
LIFKENTANTRRPFNFNSNIYTFAIQTNTMYRLALSFVLLVVIIAACKKDDSAKNDVFSDSKLLTAVRGDRPGIYDANGRFVILRGVNLNVLGDYWEANPSVPATAPYNPDHFQIMASYGFNCVRLLFNWSKLEPQRGQINQAYIAEIKGAIEDAAKHGIYIMLDLHQDAYGKYIATPITETCELPNNGWDGAPEWATFTDGQSTCKTDGSRESPPAVFHAWQNLWDNKEGIQDHLIDAWAELVKQTAQYDNVVGYDLINEPSLGYSSLADQQRKVSVFYDKLIKAIRSAERSVGSKEHIIFFEPSVTFAGGPLPTVPGPDFTNDKNIVFAPHNYFEVIGPPTLTIEQGFDLYVALSKTYNTTTLIGEWGVYGNPEQDVVKLKRFTAQEDKYIIGSTWWQWCQAPGDPHSISWDGTRYAATTLHLLEVTADGTYNGKRNEIYFRVLGRVRPVAIHGRPIKLEANPDNGHMNLNARANNSGVTELWIPDFFGTPVITGTGISKTEIVPVEGGFKAFVTVDGVYEIVVRY